MGQTTDIGGRGEIGFAGIMVALDAEVLGHTHYHVCFSIDRHARAARLRNNCFLALEPSRLAKNQLFGIAVFMIGLVLLVV